MEAWNIIQNKKSKSPQILIQRESLCVKGKF